MITLLLFSWLFLIPAIGAHGQILIDPYKFHSGIFTLGESVLGGPDVLGR